MMIHIPETPMTKDQFQANWKTLQLVIERLQALEAKIKDHPIKLGLEGKQLVLQGTFQEESRLSPEEMQRILYPAVDCWKPHTLYSQGLWIKTVEPEGLWVCRVTHTSQDFGLEQAYWDPLLLVPKDRGVWSETVSYQPGDQVLDQGDIYRCKLSCLKERPSKNTDCWYKIWHMKGAHDTIMNVETSSTSLPVWAKPLAPIFISNPEKLKEPTVLPESTLALVQHQEPLRYVWMIYSQEQWIPLHPSQLI